MERIYGDRAASIAGELAYQFHRSAGLPGAARGVDYALAAADQAEENGAWDEGAMYVRMALDLLGDGDARRGSLTGKLGISLARALSFDDAAQTANIAADAIEVSEGSSAAADYLCAAARALWSGDGQAAAWPLASRGLRLVGDRRDATWAWMRAYDLVRAGAEDPEDPGIALDTPAQREVERVLHSVRLTPTERDELLLVGALSLSSRTQVLREFANDPALLTFWAGEYRHALPLWKEQAEADEQQGDVANAVSCWSQYSRCHTALGNLDDAEDAHDHAQQLSERLTRPSLQLIQVLAASGELGAARGAFISEFGGQWRDTVAALAHESPVELRWVGAVLRSAAAWGMVDAGQPEGALQLLAGVVNALERAPGWAANYLLVASNAVYTLWRLRRADYVDVLERNLREKILPPDFRYISTDARLFLGMLSGLDHRYDDACRWLAQARSVLDEQGARPLRALVDFTEAELFLDRAASGDHGRAFALLGAALGQFRDIGMTGWIERAEVMRAALVP